MKEMTNKTPVTPEDFLLLRHPIHLTGGDSARGLAYETAVWEGQCFRHAVVLLKNGQERRFSLPDADCIEPRLSPDRNTLAYLTRRGGETCLTLYDIPSAQTRTVGARGDVTDLTWQPDGRALALVCGEAPARMYVYTPAGDSWQMLFQSEGGMRKPTFSPDGGSIAYVDMKDSAHPYCFHRKSGQRVCLSQDAFLPVKLNPLYFTADGSRVLCPGMSMKAGNELHRLFCLKADGSGSVALRHTGDVPLEVVPLYADGESLPNSSTYLCAEGDDRFLAIGVEQERAGIYRIVLSGDTAVWERLYEDHRCIAGITASHGGISVLACTQQTPMEVYTLTEGMLTRVSHENEWIDQRLIHPTICLQHYGSAETGWGIFGSGEDRPAVLLIHGGPSCYFSGGFSLEQQLLAGAGYDVIFANPHGSSGYGADYADIHLAFDGTAEQDLMSLIHEAMAVQPGIAPHRLAVMGGSYGGFMSAWLIGHHTEFKAACVLRALLGGEAMKVLLDIDENEMNRIAAQVTIPVLVMHGEKDTTCPYNYAPAYYKALGSAEKRFVSFPEARHSVGELSARDAQVFYTEILNWWRAHL